MNNIPAKLREELAADPYMRQCARIAWGGCSGRITWEHAFIYGGRQIQERWAIIPLCWFHHLGPGLHKELNQAIALANATVEELKKYPKANWDRLRAYLSKKYPDLAW